MKREALTPALSQRERGERRTPPLDSLSLWERAGVRAGGLHLLSEPTR
jgi:hypothetical protein